MGLYTELTIESTPFRVNGLSGGETWKVKLSFQDPSRLRASAVLASCHGANPGRALLSPYLLLGRPPLL